MVDEKLYRDCMAEIIGVLKKYDMAGAITVIDKERAHFRYHFPTWSCISFKGDAIRFKNKLEDYSDMDTKKRVGEWSAHIVMQMRDIAANTFLMMNGLGKQLEEQVG